MALGEFLGKILGAAGAEDGVHVRVLNELRPWIGSLTQSAMRSWLPRIASGTLCEVPERRRGRVIGECQGFGVSTCLVCMRPCCLEHGMVGSGGEIVCAECVGLAQEVVPPARRERARAQETKDEGAPPRRSQKERSDERKQQARERRERQQGAPPPGTGAGAGAGGKPPPHPEVVDQARQILGVRVDATWDDIKRAHRKLSGQWHPDKFVKMSRRDQQNAAVKFKNVQLALDVLAKVHPDAA